MRGKTWVWWLFGGVLLVGILSGFVPDAMLALQLRSARSEGLLRLPPDPPRPARSEDARPLYAAAWAKSPDAANLLESDFARQVKAPKPQVLRFLRAVVAASALPEYSVNNDSNEDGPTPTVMDSGALTIAAKALAARATGEADLLPAARIGRHVGMDPDLQSAGQRAAIALSVMDRAAKLGLGADARRRLADALGPSVSARETLRRHVARVVRELEKETRKDGMSVSRNRREATYLRFWNGFFKNAPEGAAFVEAVRRDDARIEDAEDGVGQYSNVQGIVGAVTDPWTGWATLIDQAASRLKTGR